MTKGIVRQLAEFTTAAVYSDLPPSVIEESKRLLLDSIGCALAGTTHPKGKIGVEYGRLTGGGGGEATIFGTSHRASIFGASFANGELINALDFDAILPPGHVSPYVLPGAVAIAESRRASGKELIAAIAVSHEMSYRIGKAMDYLRDTKDGKSVPPKVYGYSSTIFGATAAAALMKGMSSDLIAHALGIAGCISPVNAHWAWVQHSPSTTIKYLLAGALSQSALTAAHMAELGHRGDLMVLDDEDVGFPRFIGSARWEPAGITDMLGADWRFPAESSYKPYPHCRIMHALFDALIELVTQHDIRPEEIYGIKMYVEGFTEQPIWLNNEILDVTDAQFSMAHGIALSAHRIEPGIAWQDPVVVFDPSILALMRKVTHAPHPDYVKHLSLNAASRPARIELTARNQTFVGERLYPKGSPSPDASSAMTTEELVQKFRRNASGIMSTSVLEGVLDGLLNLEQEVDVSPLLRSMGTTAA